MKTYFAVINDRQVGPDTIDELIKVGLNANTYIWNPEMSEWRHASECPDYIAFVSEQSANQSDSPKAKQSAKPVEAVKSQLTADPSNEPKPLTTKQKRIYILLYALAAILGIWFGLKFVYYLAYSSKSQGTENVLFSIIVPWCIFGIAYLMFGIYCKANTKTKSHSKWKIIILWSGIFLTFALSSFCAYIIKGEPVKNYNLFLSYENEKYTATPGIDHVRNSLIDNWGNIVIGESDCIYRIEDKFTKEMKYLIVNFITHDIAQFDLYKKTDDDLSLESTTKYKYFTNENDAKNTDGYYAWASTFVTHKYGQLCLQAENKWVYYADM